MRLVQFIKWWWKNNDNFNRTAVCYLFFCIVPTIFTIIVIGKEGALVAVAGMVLVASYWGTYGLYHFIRNLWTEFNDANPTEDELIIRKLKGIPTPSKERENRHEYY